MNRELHGRFELLITELSGEPGDTIACDNAVAAWAIRNRYAVRSTVTHSYAANPFQTSIKLTTKVKVMKRLMHDPLPSKRLRAAAQGLIAKAQPFGVLGERFFVKASDLRRLERALTAADAEVTKDPDHV